MPACFSQKASPGAFQFLATFQEKGVVGTGTGEGNSRTPTIVAGDWGSYD